SRAPSRPLTGRTRPTCSKHDGRLLWCLLYLHSLCRSRLLGLPLRPLPNNVPVPQLPRQRRRRRRRRLRPDEVPCCQLRIHGRRRAHPPLYVLAPHAGARIPAPASAVRRPADGQRRSLRPAAAAARHRGGSAGLFGFGAGWAAVRLGATARTGVSTHADAGSGRGEPIPATATGIYGRETIGRGASAMIPFLYPGL
ncbi:hypothetical protein B0H13DRAFT_2478910, partial [Mycena leptocephala]